MSVKPGFCGQFTFLSSAFLQRKLILILVPLNLNGIPNHKGVRSSMLTERKNLDEHYFLRMSTAGLPGKYENIAPNPRMAGSNHFLLQAYLRLMR